ncbi:galactose oxidase [Roridomyces roridus]|uniref:Galactose oxidase n=1 Tax=Roridomyces roridus TaxID=1738132 RepID=A0AAD7FQT4_9AGAR|nr:galactose oxidase [Roridomyces roridus]
MAKKKSSNAAAAKTAKKAKAAQKIERKSNKKSKKVQDDEDSDDDLESVLRETAITEEVADGPPSRRANATLTACPSGNYLWCIGGEWFSEDGKAYFYSDVYRYSPEKDEWRRFISKTCGEFSSVHQTNFHHYADFWCFDVQTHSWDRIDTKIRPSPRSGHRMAIWKHFIVLFGGFYDPGITTKYHNDLWVFDLQEYKWRQIEFKPTDSRPSPRSGFSFLSTPEGILLHGGYCKEYAKGKRPVGVMLEDSWFLKMSLATEPSTAYAPSLRSGCTMALWNAKSTGILFGGVTDEDTGEETLESVFWNDLYGYLVTGKGKWVSMTLKRPKNQNKGGKKKIQPQVYKPEPEDHGDSQDEDEIDTPQTPAAPPRPVAAEIDPDDPLLTTPFPRYNALIAVLRNTLYIYGGIYERGKREYTLDDFYSIQLDKLDRYTCLKKSEYLIADGDDESSSEDEDEDDDDEDEEEEDDEEEAEDEVQVDNSEVVEDVQQPPDEESDIRLKAAAFMGESKERSPEDALSTPMPGETLAMFYARTRTHWAQKAHSGSSENQGKQLRRDGFALAEETYDNYKPILKEIEKILAEAGLDEQEMARSAQAGGIKAEQNRNRR